MTKYKFSYQSITVGEFMSNLEEIGQYTTLSRERSRREGSTEHHRILPLKMRHLRESGVLGSSEGPTPECPQEPSNGVNPRGGWRWVELAEIIEEHDQIRDGGTFDLAQNYDIGQAPFLDCQARRPIFEGTTRCERMVLGELPDVYERRERIEGVSYIYCPCCGSAWGAASDPLGFFHDGQPLLCGCSGQVSFDSETDPDIVTDYCEGSCPEPANTEGTAWSRKANAYVPFEPVSTLTNATTGDPEPLLFDTQGEGADDV